MYLKSPKDLNDITYIINQALDQDFTEENRQRCAEAAKPLTDAVDELTTFASSPEFASMPAKISPEVITVNEKLLINTGSKTASDI